jgi:hypothetical protein
MLGFLNGLALRSFWSGAVCCKVHTFFLLVGRPLFHGFAGVVRGTGLTVGWGLA